MLIPRTRAPGGTPRIALHELDCSILSSSPVRPNLKVITDQSFPNVLSQMLFCKVDGL